MNESEIARQLAQALSQSGNCVIGSVSGILPDGTVNVFSEGKITNAIATSNIPGGSNCIAVKDGNNWYAVGESSGQVVGERVMRSRKYRQQSKPQATYPFKVLFSVEENGVRKFYVGGDRTTPTLIYEVPDSHLVYSATLTNTGTHKDDWVAGIKTAYNPIFDTISQFYPRYTFNLVILKPKFRKLYTEEQRFFYPGNGDIQMLYEPPALRAIEHHGGGFFSSRFLWLAQYHRIANTEKDWFAFPSSDSWTTVYRHSALCNNELFASIDASTHILPNITEVAIPIATTNNLPAFSCSSTIIASSNLEYAIIFNSAYASVDYGREGGSARVIMPAYENTSDAYARMYGKFFELSDYGIDYPSNFYLVTSAGDKKVINFNDFIPIMNPSLTNLVAKNNSLALYIFNQPFDSRTFSNSSIEVTAYPLIHSQDGIILGETKTIQSRVLPIKSPFALIHSISYFPEN